MARAKSTKKKDSLIPILFTLGVIGWGFFAIDRLTTPKGEESLLMNTATSASSTSKKARTHQSSWKATALKWLNESLVDKKVSKKLKNLSTAKSKKHEIVKQQSKIGISSELTIIKEDLALKPVSENAGARQIKLYFYEIKNDNRIRLKFVKRQITQQTLIEQAKMAISLLLKGPLGNEQLKDFTNSFPNRPRLLGVHKDGATLLLNFDERFGRGVSFQMLRYQITQILKTAKQFKGIASISILIRNKQIESLGGDGLLIPAKITSANWQL